MTVATFTQPNYLTQSASAYKASLDAAIAVLQSIGGDFAPHAQSSPNMQIVVDAGRIFKPGGTMVTINQQITGALAAPTTNSRIDRVVVDSENGIYSVLTGTEAATPVSPAIPNGKLPVCQISMTVGMTTIANSIITDERTTYGPLAKLMRMPVEQVASATSGFTREVLLSDRGLLFDCDCSNGPVNILLPDSAQAGNGFMIGVMKSDTVANSITLTPSTTGENFSDGAGTKQVSVQNGVVLITTDGLGQWYLAFDSSRTYNNVTLTGPTTLAGTSTMSAKSLWLAEGADVASASSCNIWGAADGNTVHITGSSTITTWGTAPQAGTVMFVIFDGAAPLTYNATTNKLNTNGSNYTTAAGDRGIVYAETPTSFVVTILPLDGLPPVDETRIQAFTTAGTFTNGFTVPRTSVFVDIVGGGAGSGAEDNDVEGGGGGGSGAGIRGFLISGLTVGATLDVIVGAAGAGGTIPGPGAGTDGTAGTSSSVTVGGGGATYVTCGGGFPGQGQTNGNAGGAVGTSTSAISQATAGATGTVGLGGAGGHSIFGAGGAGGTGASGNTPSSTSYGAGAGATYNGGGASTGAAGRQGAVVFRW